MSGHKLPDDIDPDELIAGLKEMVTSTLTEAIDSAGAKVSATIGECSRELTADIHELNEMVVEATDAMRQRTERAGARLRDMQADHAPKPDGLIPG